MEKKKKQNNPATASQFGASAICFDANLRLQAAQQRERGSVGHLVPRNANFHSLWHVLLFWQGLGKASYSKQRF